MPGILERDVSKQVKDFLEARGWRAIRTQFAFSPGAFQTGEPGMPDYLFLRYEPGGRALVLFIEVKGPRDQRKCNCVPGSKKVCKVCRQKNWQAREKQRGARVIVVDDAEWFFEQYERAYAAIHKGDEARGQLELL